MVARKVPKYRHAHTRQRNTQIATFLKNSSCFFEEFSDVFWRFCQCPILGKIQRFLGHFRYLAVPFLACAWLVAEKNPDADFFFKCLRPYASFSLDFCCIWKMRFSLSKTGLTCILFHFITEKWLWENIETIHYQNNNLAWNLPVSNTNFPQLWLKISPW